MYRIKNALAEMTKKGYSEATEIHGLLEKVEVLLGKFSEKIKNEMIVAIGQNNFDFLEEGKELLEMLSIVEENLESSNLQVGDIGSVENDEDDNVEELEEEIRNIDTNITNINSNKRSRDKVYTLKNDLRNRKPSSYKFNGIEKEVSNWRHFAEEISKDLYNINKELFKSFVSNKEMNGTKLQYFAYTDDDMIAPMYIGEEGKGIYVDLARLTSNNNFFIKKMLKMFGFAEDEVSIKIDKKYMRKQKSSRNKSS